MGDAGSCCFLRSGLRASCCRLLGGDGRVKATAGPHNTHLTTRFRRAVTRRAFSVRTSRSFSPPLQSTWRANAPPQAVAATRVASRDAPSQRRRPLAAATRGSPRGRAARLCCPAADRTDVGGRCRRGRPGVDRGKIRPVQRARLSICRTSQGQAGTGTEWLGRGRRRPIDGLEDYARKGGEATPERHGYWRTYRGRAGESWGEGRGLAGGE